VIVWLLETVEARLEFLIFLFELRESGFQRRDFIGASLPGIGVGSFESVGSTARGVRDIGKGLCTGEALPWRDCRGFTALAYPLPGCLCGPRRSR
jgi:hypothetical protein